MYVDKYAGQRKDVNFMKKYSRAVNAATGSEVDANANVSNKNIATMASEIHKKENIYANRLVMYDKITEMFGGELAEEYIRQLEEHEIYRHDESGMPVGTPYCCSITLYPLLLHGLKPLGGTSDAPKNLDSFCGGFINLVFAVAAQFAGATATPEFLSYLSYFLTKEYGDDYYLRADEVVDMSLRKRTIRDVIHAKFQQIVYSLNQPAAARGSQSVFWNIAYFDKPYFMSLFEGFVFPDGTLMVDLWESVRWIQREFMMWFNEERRKKVLTFPVESFSLLNDGKQYVDADAADWVAEMYAQGHSFFTYTSDSVDSLASCCRLRNGVEKNTFSYSLGAGGIATGSKCVMTININRLVQNAVRDGVPICDRVKEQVEKIHKYLTAFNEIINDKIADHMLPVYEAGYVTPEKQYLTVGINGFNEGAEFLDIVISDNEAYQNYAEMILRPIYELNRADRTDEIMWNTELVPGENLGIRNASCDKKDGYVTKRDCYNSYFYLPEDESVNVIDKFILHGRKYTRYCDGGSALHCNLKEHLSKHQYAHLLRVAIQTGCPYFTFNIPNTICNQCGHIEKHYLNACPKCGSEDVDFITRCIGYLVRIKSMAAGRMEEAKKRFYA